MRVETTVLYGTTLGDLIVLSHPFHGRPLTPRRPEALGDAGKDK